MTPEKFSPIERTLVAAASMPAPAARKILMLICESGLVPQLTEGQKHYARREKFINRMQSATDRICNYARHETLRNVELHYRNPAIRAAEGDQPDTPEEIARKKALAERLAFEKAIFGTLLAGAIREESASILGTAGQQAFDEMGVEDKPFRITLDDAREFFKRRANLLSGVPAEIHKQIMDSIQQGLDEGDSRKGLMDRISNAFDEIKSGRAKVIAHTETHAAFNYARDKAMQEAGVTHKRWLHSQSPEIKHPRPTHVDADGMVVPVDEPFDVAGVKFMYPTDDSLGAGPEDIISCSCVAIPVESPP